MRHVVEIIGLCLFLCSALNGQSAAGPFFQFTYQNDYFGGTDYYFTQGIRLQYTAPGLGRSPLARLLPRLTGETSQAHSLFLAQDGYTPTSIRADSILRGDRPYAGALYLGQEASSTAGAWRLQSAVLLGVIGPWALAGEEQEFIHRQLDNVLPMGWQHQIANDLLLNYELEIDHTVYPFSWLSSSGGAHAALGSYRTRAGLQGEVRFGWLGSSSAGQHRRGNQLYSFVAGRGSAIGYDATLQGGPFNRSSPYTLNSDEVERFVLAYDWGVRLKLGKFGLSFARSYLTPEFRGGRRHGWGTVQLTFYGKE